MPNWCSYAVTFYGDEEAIKTLDKAVTMPEPEESYDSDGIHDLTLTYPVPEELRIVAGLISEDDPEYASWVAKKEANVTKYGHSDWYWWCVHNWGTKWPPSVAQYDIYKSSHGDLWAINLSGESAWSPPSELIQHITKHYKVSAIITYEEGGMCFAGAEAYVAGDQTYNGYFDYDSVPEIVATQAKLDDTDDGDDYELWEEYNDAVRNAVDGHEVMAFQSLELKVGV